MMYPIFSIFAAVFLFFSPIAAQCAQKQISGIITEDTIWNGEVAVNGMVMVAPQATLSIEPGTKVRFSNVSSSSGLIIEGRLNAAGSSSMPVVFEPVDHFNPARWKGIWFMGSEKSNRMEQVRITRGDVCLKLSSSSLKVSDLIISECLKGVVTTSSSLDASALNLSASGNAMLLSGGDTKIRNSKIHANEYGLYLKNGSLMLSDTEISKNRKRGVSVISSQYRIEGSQFYSNAVAGLFDGGEGSIARCRIESQSGDGLHFSGSRVRLTGNLLSNNGGNALTVRDDLPLVSRNIFEDNGGFDIFNGSTETFNAPANWWKSDNPAKLVKTGGVAIVDIAPVLSDRPLDP